MTWSYGKRWRKPMARSGLLFLLLAFAITGLAVPGYSLLAPENTHRPEQAPTGLTAPPLTRATPAELSLFPTNFTQVNEQGFGDRQNSYAWSMIWWRGKLYVGTNRAFRCVEVAAFDEAVPGFPFSSYPPEDPEVACAPTPQDLPLQAEIWRYTPETGVWERVYQSPNDVPIPDHPDKYVARDIGFRDMKVFEESDGTEALYVASLSSRNLNPGVPPPRLLRTTDGLTFEAVPQDPGTTLGDIDAKSMRTLAVYKGRLYLVIGTLYGSGPLYEAEDPASGNNSFRPVSPEDVQVFEMMPYNGYLYVGTRDLVDGYSVLKTDASGTPPYTFTTVIPPGAYREGRKAKSVISMFIFKDRLYVGTDKPPELIRINPDDTWDLIVGEPRNTPQGRKIPFSGIGDGFDWAFNLHIWRMGEYQDWLYMGTIDASTAWHYFAWAQLLLESQMGFDLFATQDGWYIREITRTGFGHKFDIGARTFATTPYGLALGTANYHYGTRVYLGVTGPVYTTFLPAVVKGLPFGVLARSLVSDPLALIPRRAPPGRLPAPQRLEVEDFQRAAVLSWLPPAGAVRFHIFRSKAIRYPELESPELGSEVWVPGPYEEMALTDRPLFLDTTIQPHARYYYYVLAEDERGRLSPPSNLVRVPNLGPKVTFRFLAAFLARHTPDSQTLTPPPPFTLTSTLQEVQVLVREGNWEGALTRLDTLQRHLEETSLIQARPWLAEDVDILLGKLARRIMLAQLGLLSAEDLQ